MGKKIIIFILLVVTAIPMWGESKAIHKKNVIKLKSINDQIKIGYETSYAIIYFGKNDVLKQLGKMVESKHLDPRLDSQLIKELKAQSDTINNVTYEIIIPDWHNQSKSIDLKSYDLAGIIDQWVLRPLVLKGKSEILNKTTKMYESHITYNFIRDQLGGESCYYTFTDGTEFYNQIISLGE
jgi:hypothetical protein